MGKLALLLIIASLLSFGAPEAEARDLKAKAKPVARRHVGARVAKGKKGRRVATRARPRARTADRRPAARAMRIGSQEVDKPLKVQGQSRNLSMLLVLKGEKEQIRFGEIRENYKEEITRTNF